MATHGGTADPVRARRRLRVQDPAGELEEAVARLVPEHRPDDLLIGVEHGDDAAVVRISPTGRSSPPPTFSPRWSMTPRTFGQIAAANALSDVYAVGGEPLVALNLLGWPRDVLSADLAAEVLAGGLEIARQAGCHVAGGHSIDDPEPKYGMAVTGLADPDRLLRIDAGAGRAAAVADQAARHRRAERLHKATGEVSEAAVEVMTTLNAGRQPGRAGGGPAVRDRRDGVRAARARVQAGAGERGHAP